MWLDRMDQVLALSQVSGPYIGSSKETEQLSSLRLSNTQHALFSNFEFYEIKRLTAEKV